MDIKMEIKTMSVLMSRIAKLIFILLLISGQIQAQVEEDEKYSKEPEDLYELNVNGKVFTTVQGKVIKIDSLLRPQIHVMQLPQKKFENGFCSFLYDRKMSFEYETDSQVRTWTLSVPNVTIMLFDLPVIADLADVANGVVSKFKEGSCKISDTTVKIGNRTLTGKIVDIALAEQHLRQEYYSVGFDKGGGGYILIQDMVGSWGHSLEYARVLRLLHESLVFKPKAKP